jgi:hypothetical protein
VTLTGLAVSDALPTNMKVASTPGLSNTCGGGDGELHHGQPDHRHGRGQQ